MLRINRRNSDSGERVLFETRPRLIVRLKSAIFKFIIVLLLLYFFTTIIRYAALLQGSVSTIVTVPVVTGTTYGVLIIILLLLMWILWNILSWRSENYRLTNQRVMVKSGVIRKNNVYMHYNKIQDIIISQSITERITNSGDIEIFGGHDRTSLILEDIPNPGEVENMINRMIEGDDSEFETNPPEEPQSAQNNLRSKKPQKPEKRQSVMEEYDKKFKL
ncbi:PH domain-containing protein [Methanobacterium sp.]|uniref:PH domain-containing protein n=1 Tax=Methanobacterium sp. TaxID=2164 RepID=UPI003C7733B6